MAHIELTAENFDEIVMRSEKPILVDFYATWCGPCKMIAPVLEELAERHPQLTVAKLDVDTATPIAIRYGVSSIPTLLLFENGKLVDRTLGYTPLEALERWLSKNHMV